MAMANFVAYRALKNGETPVACILVHEPTQKVLSFGCNDTNRSLNGTRHAEFMAIDRILEEHSLLNTPTDKVKAFFANVTLYVTIEPCVMCALALLQMGFGKVYFGAANDRFGGNGTVIKVQKDDDYLSVGGIMRVEAVHLLRSFYIQENGSAPVPKIKKNKEIDGKEFPPNLAFSKYMDRRQFCSEYGESRAETFFEHPHPDFEITPVVGQAYGFADLLSANSFQDFPHIEELYPDQQVAIQGDIDELSMLLPSVGTDGKVMPLSIARKRKLEQV